VCIMYWKRCVTAVDRILFRNCGSPRVQGKKNKTVSWCGVQWHNGWCRVDSNTTNYLVTKKRRKKCYQKYFSTSLFKHFRIPVSSILRMMDWKITCNSRLYWQKPWFRNTTLSMGIQSWDVLRLNPTLSGWQNSPELILPTDRKERPTR
jgi:hypothetical protein